MKDKRGLSYILVFAQISILLMGIIAFMSIVSGFTAEEEAVLMNYYGLPKGTTFAIGNDGIYRWTKPDGIIGIIAYNEAGFNSKLTTARANSRTETSGGGAPLPAEKVKPTKDSNAPATGNNGGKDTNKATSGLLSKLLIKSPGNPVMGIVQGAVWGGIVYGAISLIGPMLTDNEALVDSLSTSLGAGVFAGRSVTNLVSSRKMPFMSEGGKFIGMNAGTAGFVVGGVVTVAIFLATYKETTTEIIQFSCEPWEAPIGGKKCEDCNKQNLPCSEYQCRSLGQACQLINQGSNEEACAWLNRKDVMPPVITEWEDALLIDYSYKPGQFTSPGDRGAKIVYDKSADGCIPAYTPLSFGINADEPARCKIDYQRKATFDEMAFDFGGSNLFRYNHSQVLSLPGPNSAENGSVVLENDGEFELFIRCMDANGNGDPANRVSGGEGNQNTASFVFQFCVDKGPDTTPPMIITTDVLNGMPVSFNTTSTDIKLYINEPSSCRWSRNDQAYEDMETDMVCKSNVIEMNARMLYECQTTLSGLKDRQENKFYFRCEDQPHMPENDRARNQQSYEFSLMGSQPLILNEVGPNGTIKDSTDVVKVTLTAKTLAGYEEGKSTCYYSETDSANSYIAFYTTNKANGEHEQDLHLPSGSYSYFIKCIDLGGNADKKTTTFMVESDRIAPLIARAYHEENYLKLITSEDAECVYGTNDCNYLFDDGVKMTVVNDIEHFTDWDTRTNYYIKCQDEWGNQPNPNECSMIARAVDSY